MRVMAIQVHIPYLDKMNDDEGNVKITLDNLGLKSTTCEISINPAAIEAYGSSCQVHCGTVDYLLR
jgi:hypothetical protein